MSGGSLDYFCFDLDSHVGDFKDRELDDLVHDLAELFHVREWYLSADTGEGDWQEARDAFKKKWFAEGARQERVEKYLEEIRQETLELFGFSNRYCKNCIKWAQEEDYDNLYGRCSKVKGCLMHRSDSCDQFVAK